jgi:hypothetical protein
MNIKPSNIEKLEREGWTRQFTADEPRLSEVIALYEEMGLEVHLESFIEVQPSSEFPITGRKCSACFKGVENQHKIIFIRKKVT